MIVLFCLNFINCITFNLKKTFEIMFKNLVFYIEKLTKFVLLGLFQNRLRFNKQDISFTRTRKMGKSDVSF